MKTTNRSTGAAASAGLLAALVLAASCGRPRPPLTEVTAFACDTLPGDPAAAAWKQVPAYTAARVPQDLVEPRLLHASTASMRVQALHDGTRIAFRMEWVDSTRDDLPGAARFPDGCAVQLPAAVQADVPAPQQFQHLGRRLPAGKAAHHLLAEGIFQGEWHESIRLSL